MRKPFDVFLSHSSADKPEVEAIAQRLREAGLNPFLDKWHLIPGQPWQEAVEEALLQCDTVAIFIGPSGISPWHNEQLRAAIDRAANSRGEYRAIPVLLPGASEESLSPFLARRTWVDFRRGIDDQSAFEQLIAGIEQQANPRQLSTRYGVADNPQFQNHKPERVVNIRPLEAKLMFKNRLREIQELRNHLALAGVRLITIVGRSGMGKTALVSHILADLESGTSLLPGTPASLDVDSIIYLSSRSTGLSLEQIFAGVGRVLGESEAHTLSRRWRDKGVTLPAKVDFLLEALHSRSCIILLDNFEDVLAEDGSIADEGLRVFVEHSLALPGRVRLLVTSQTAVKVPAEALGAVRNVVLTDGLPEEEAISLLRDLDPQGMLGLRGAPESDLRKAAHLARGIPRALEILAGILHQDPTTNLGELLDDENYLGDQVLEHLVAAGYERLSTDDRRVMEALSVLNRPVGEAAITYLLHPWYPTLKVRPCLRRLSQGYYVRASRADAEYSLHPLDREYVYSRIPSPNSSVTPGTTYNRLTLEMRAAEFYADIQKPQNEWKTLVDISPQLYQIEHYTRAGQFDAACTLLDEIDVNYLSLWGHYLLLIELRQRLIGKPQSFRLQMHNRGRLGVTYGHLARYEDAIQLLSQALNNARELHDRRSEGVWTSHLANAHRSLGEFDQGIRLSKDALDIASELGDLQLESDALDGLGHIYRDTEQHRDAINCYSRIVDIARSGGDRRREGYAISLLALTHRSMGKIEQSIELNITSLAIARETGNRRSEGAILGHLGIAYDLLGDLELAIEHYNLAISIAQQIGDRRAEGIWYNRLGYHSCTAGRLAEAVSFYERSLAIAKDIGDKRGESLCLIELGKLSIFSIIRGE